MKRITPHLWFDKEAKEAATFYTALFENSKITNATTLRDTPSGNADVVSLELAGQPFAMISAGPLFRFNPSISFLVGCDTKAEVDALWAALSKGGKVLMELGAYPFSERYGWTEDRFGLSWQIIFNAGWHSDQKIVPTMMFTGKQAGRAEEAMKFYASIFPNSSIGTINRYGNGEEPDKEGTVRHADFKLNGETLSAMDSARTHGFAFNEAISLMVPCETQKEIDYYWERLSADPKAEQCGWLKDKFGVSWQVTPTIMSEMMASHDSKKIARVTQAFLQMKKFDISRLQQAFNG
jgi:predicted 3-demethylubiquinone-9 3-methyltransferase (glyoxalase superfamily)